jgi:hypothetical protein
VIAPPWNNGATISTREASRTSATPSPPNTRRRTPTLTDDDGGKPHTHDETGLDVFDRQPDGGWKIIRYIDYPAEGRTIQARARLHTATPPTA